MSRIARQRAAGFTLLELLVAVGVLAVMGTIAYGGLGALARNTVTTTAAAERFGAVSRAVMLLERDVRGAVPRATRDLLGDALPALAGGAETLTLTRGGWDNPLDQPRPTLQRVSWARRGGTLVRIGWPVLDRAQGTEPVVQELVAGVDVLRVEFLARRETEWLDVWPPPAPRATDDGGGGRAPEPWPVAVRVLLEIEDFGRVERVLELAGTPS